MASPPADELLPTRGLLTFLTFLTVEPLPVSTSASTLCFMIFVIPWAETVVAVVVSCYCVDESRDDDYVKDELR